MQAANKFRPSKKKIRTFLSPAQLEGKEPLPSSTHPVVAEPTSNADSYPKIVLEEKARKAPLFQATAYKMGSYKPISAPVETLISSNKESDSAVNSGLQPTNTEVAPALPLSKEELWELLRQFLKKSGKISLFTALEKVPSELGDHLVTYPLENLSLLEDVTPLRQDLVELLRKQSGWQYVDLQFRVEASKSVEQKFLSPKERYKQMVELNPALKLLKDKLDLDLE